MSSHFNSNIGDSITIEWTDIVNQNVTQYQIWRFVKHNGVTGDPQLLATVGRGVQSFTDYDYTKTSSYVDLLQYDVRSYYSTEGTYSDASWYAVYGEIYLYKTNENNLILAQLGKEIPTEYSISNFPNPFNPTTVINYQLPESGMVTLKVYDLLGKEVATLVNESKNAGYYNVNFDASKLTSGIYIYTIQANNFIKSNKMLLLR